MPRYTVTSYITVTLLGSIDVEADDEDTAIDEGFLALDEKINALKLGSYLDLSSIDDHNDTQAEELPDPSTNTQE